MKFDQFISLFTTLFDVGIPLTVIASVGIITCVASIIAYCIGQHRYKTILYIWLLAYLFMMLYSTVLGRLGGLSGLSASHGSSVHLMPFWSIGAIQDGYVETIYEKIYNVLFFIPYGILLGVNGGFGDSTRFRGFNGAVLIGFMTSVGIELLQLITRTGMCETDDVICNTLGCVIGVMVSTAIGWSIEKIKYK